MPKLKTKRKAAKRFRVTKNGKVLAFKTGRRHLLGDKTTKEKRHMRGASAIDPAMARSIKRVLPYV